MKNDPDNWLRIPDFGVMPAEVNYEGFSLPILGPGITDVVFQSCIANIVRQSRSIARRIFSSHSDLVEVALIVLVAMRKAAHPSSAGTTQKPIKSDAIVAVNFYLAMLHLEACLQSYRRSKAISLQELAMGAACLLNMSQEVVPNLEDLDVVPIAHKGGVARAKKFESIKEWLLPKWIAFCEKHSKPSASQFVREIYPSILLAFPASGKRQVSVTERAVYGWVCGFNRT